MTVNGLRFDLQQDVDFRLITVLEELINIPDIGILMGFKLLNREDIRIGRFKEDL